MLVYILPVFGTKIMYKHSNVTLEKEKYIPSYFKANARVVVSFTTIPSRIHSVPKVIEKLKNQTLKPDKIYICIPYFSKRKKIPYIIPKDWNFEENIKIVRCKDYGPATKLLGCIPYENDPETMIITVDDDQNYPKNTISNIVWYAMKYPNSCLSRKARAKNLIKVISTKKNLFTSPYVYYLEGYGTPLYRRKYITKDMINYFENNLSKECFLSDDLTISAWLNSQNVKLIKLNEEDKFVKDKDIDNIDPLYMTTNRVRDYLICSNEVKRYINK